ncbi:hypothetical protein A3G67_01390 [Candidatus Roizmanbacteria bacterium RIFCSPLOWO2_12_FULL_40_12]|uniref:Uncharacterized protein n=1 Tax=Candidatus Roizmanbacteria bacterium RIFCSPLOWO2_01_FULL_40_42 TaxID=1802066 RepID=A0A1F7J474_9BACT|nr:MAG: hypothetical protein A2779_00090 [Candidatus Roizmanbacteria bacterium RIFCSPHIGHO2_01_FULL_40_98]OGK28494.1 MAG: hypothetical protein A3C31_02865 [Candidatus Roizmanbacteria bacterium RIFCSPHIGHO2_02_FULL_40_53]OGK29385.1 MAG: hypothetical protein A2W49_00615 [Candidatus Roizmanbacteria bacterium RIFCSPHIGHO2_12_41_18]OGK36526.1 MAG: hypothetical protein A3E69_03080 [Candidatus Roizmanbacteria bacterium RIFCSPHIGHO2_12_FULL_40_130]OGK50411.1 MAG: hypothetical protein A3B50_04645 [Candi
MSINASERLREYDDYGLNQKIAKQASAVFLRRQINREFLFRDLRGDDNVAPIALLIAFRRDQEYQKLAGEEREHTGTFDYSSPFSAFAYIHGFSIYLGVQRRYRKKYKAPRLERLTPADLTRFLSIGQDEEEDVGILLDQLGQTTACVNLGRSSYKRTDQVEFMANPLFLLGDLPISQTEFDYEHRNIGASLHPRDNWTREIRGYKPSFAAGFNDAAVLHRGRTR